LTDDIHNVPDFLRDAATFVPYEDREHVVLDPNRRRCRACGIRKPRIEFEKVSSNVCKGCKGTSTEKRNRAIRAAQSARQAAKREGRG
jgi:hypothetical protein